MVLGRDLLTKESGKYMSKVEKKKLLIIVGAGASVEFGMPSVSDIDTLFDKLSNEIFHVPSCNISLYKYLQRRIIDYFKSVQKPIKTGTNFEEILYTALNVSSMNNHNRTNPISALYDFKSFPQVEVYGQSPREIKYYDFSQLSLRLIDGLLIEFRSRCSSLNDRKHDELNTLETFLSNLKERFDLGVLTFNYDNVLLSQLSSPVVTGFDPQGRFNPSLILNNKSWNFIYHLHGSVHFDMHSNDNGLHNVTFNHDLNSTFQQNSFGRSGETTIEGQYVPTSNIIAGYGKSYQIQRNPYYLYFTDFGRKIYEADALLFAGYGFNDIYVNNIVEESFNFNRNRPVVVLTYSYDNEDPMQFRSDNWTRNLIKTIETNVQSMSTEKYAHPPRVHKMKDNKEFEISKDTDKPLAIWHNGFLAACNNSKLIIDEFDRQFNGKGTSNG